MNRCKWFNNSCDDGRYYSNCHNDCRCFKRVEETRFCMPSYHNYEDREEKCFEGYIKICPKQDKHRKECCDNKNNFFDSNDY